MNDSSLSANAANEGYPLGNSSTKVKFQLRYSRLSIQYYKHCLILVSFFGFGVLFGNISPSFSLRLLRKTRRGLLTGTVQH